MDNIYRRNKFHHYNNYNNIGNMELYQFDNINESPLGDNYMKDLMLEEAKLKGYKNRIKSNDININNFFDFKKKDIFERTNYTDKKYNNNNSFRKIIDEYSNMNKTLYKNVMNNNYKNNWIKNDNINTETMNKFSNSNINIPFRYKPRYPKSNKIDNHFLDYINNKKEPEQNPNSMMRIKRYNNQPMNKITSIKVNINNKTNFMINSAEKPIPRKNNIFKNDFCNNSKQQNNKNENYINNMNEDEFLNNLANDLYNLGLKNKVKNNISKKNKLNNNNNKIINNNMNNNNNNNINNNKNIYINKNKEEKKEKEILINNNKKNKEFSTGNKNNQVEEVGCQAINIDNNIKIDIKNTKVDSSNDIQTSLMPNVLANKIEFQISNVHCFNIIDEKKEEFKEEKSKKFSENPQTDLISNKEKKNEDIKSNNIINNANNKNRKNSSNILTEKSQSEKSKNLGSFIIDSDKEREMEEEEKKKKKNRRVKINENQNIYFNFLQNDIINACQVKKGKNGDLENFQPKSDVDNMDSLIMFEIKSAIKPFKKEEIRVDKTYKLRENMEEWRIIPELYEDEEVVDDNVVNDLANSLTSSIDKSTKASLNESLKRSITQSYNHSMIGSLITSINNTEGQGILKKLTAAFGESLNQEE